MTKTSQVPWKLIGGLVVGLATILALLVAILQLWQSKSASDAQDAAQATQIAVLQSQLDVQKEIATLQPGASESGLASTLVAQRVSDLKNTQAALETLEARIRLTPTTAPKGDLIIDENFEDGLANGYTIGGVGGNWEVVDDGTGNKVFLVASSNAGWADSQFGPPDFSDGTIQFRVKLLSYDLSTDTGSGVVTNGFRIIFDHGGYVFALHPYGERTQLSYFGSNGSWVVMNGGATHFRFEKDIWYSVQVTTQGEQITAYLNGNIINESSDSQYKAGALTMGAGPNTKAQFDDVRVWTSK